MDFLLEHWKDIATFLAGGLTGSFLTFRFTGKNNVRGRGSVTDQSGASAGGDVVGGNKTTNGRR
jgi:hypothetical protein